MNGLRHGREQWGFTLVELIIILMIIGLLSLVFAHRLPSDIQEEAAVRELRRAVRLAQHKAMTRQYISSQAAWGIIVTNNEYSVLRQNATDCGSTPPPPANCAEADYLGRQLLNDSAMTLSGGPVWFNGLGEPIDPTTGAPLTTTTTFTVAGVKTVTVSPRTGFVQ